MHTGHAMRHGYLERHSPFSRVLGADADGRRQRNHLLLLYSRAQPVAFNGDIKLTGPAFKVNSGHIAIQLHNDALVPLAIPTIITSAFGADLDLQMCFQLGLRRGQLRARPPFCICGQRLRGRIGKPGPCLCVQPSAALLLRRAWIAGSPICLPLCRGGVGPPRLCRGPPGTPGTLDTGSGCADARTLGLDVLGRGHRRRVDLLGRRRVHLVRKQR